MVTKVHIDNVGLNLALSYINNNIPSVPLEANSSDVVFDLWCDFEIDTGLLLAILIFNFFLCKLIEITLYCFKVSPLDYCTMTTIINCVYLQAE